MELKIIFSDHPQGGIDTQFKYSDDWSDESDLCAFVGEVLGIYTKMLEGDSEDDKVAIPLYENEKREEGFCDFALTFRTAGEGFEYEASPVSLEQKKTLAYYARNRMYEVCDIIVDAAEEEITSDENRVLH